MATAGLIQNGGIEQIEAEEVAVTPTLRQDQLATSTPTSSDGVQLPQSLFDSLVETLRENRLAQLASVEQQREVIRYMRGLDEWLERDVHDRQSELRGVVSRVEQLGHALRGAQMQSNGIARTSSSNGSVHSALDTPNGRPKILERNSTTEQSTPIASHSVDQASGFAAGAAAAPSVGASGTENIENISRHPTFPFLPLMTATDHHTTVSSLQVPQASQPNSGTMVMLGVGSNNNQAQAYPVATIIIQSPSQQQQQQQYISQSYPQIPPTVIYPGTTSGPPVVPSMDGRFYSSQMYPPPQPTVIVRSKSHTRSRSRSPRRGRHHSPRGRSRSPRALREHTPPPVVIQPVAPDKYTHGPSRTPSPEERPYDDWVEPRVRSPIRTRSYPSPRTREAEEANSAVLQAQMAKELGDLREMFKKLTEEKEKERLQQARFSLSKNEDIMLYSIFGLTLLFGPWLALKVKL